MIPTTVDRDEMYEALCEELFKQVAEMGLNLNQHIEIIGQRDNKEISVGLKRQQLLERAKGIFVSGFDSDDWPHKDYIHDIWNVLYINKDVIDHVGFIEDCDIDGNKSRSIFSIKHPSWENKEPGYDQVRCANPKSVIRRTKALQVGFVDLRFGEDIIFSEAVTPLLASEIFIDKPLYFYNHVSTPFNERYGVQL